MPALNTFCTRKFDLTPGESGSFQKNRHRSRYITYMGKACGVLIQPNALLQHSDYVQFDEWRIELWVHSEHDGPRTFQLFKQRFMTPEKAVMFLKENADSILAIFELWHPAENPWEKYSGIIK